MVTFPLTNRPDLFACVDDIDADLAGLAWYWKKSKTGFYVVRGVRTDKSKTGHVRTLRLHREVQARKQGRAVDKRADVHHKDTNTLNNTRDNLASVGRVTHGHFSKEAAAYDKWAESKYGPAVCV